MSNTKRDSGIELYKIIAIALIVISHVIHTLHAGNALVPYDDYIVNLTQATADIQTFILILLRHLGCFGNNMFFICSAWFFLGSSAVKKRKWFIMLIEVWVISVVILIASLIIRHGDITKELIIKSLLPSLFSNNWYITCYLIFYPLHPLLNMVIGKMDRKGLFRVTGVLVVINCFLIFIQGNILYTSDVTLWITMYFVLAYLKRYKEDLLNDTKFNAVLLAVGVIGFIGLVGVTDYAGLHIGALSNKVLHWMSNGNPFIIAACLGGFGLMRRLTFKNSVINYFASLTLLVYLIHENILVRTYLRPAMWEYIYTNYGYGHIALWALALAVVILLLSFIAAVIYDLTVRRLVTAGGGALYTVISRLYLKCEKRLLDK